MVRSIVFTLAALISISAVLLGSAQEELLQAGVGTPVTWTVEGTPVHTASTVAIVDDDEEFFVFMPKNVSVPVGATVIWENHSSDGHTVVSKPDGGATFMSGDDDHPIEVNKSFSHTFETAGDFMYECGIHPFMEGTVSVNP